MLLRKINAVLTLICTFLLLNHAVFIALYVFSQGRILNPLHAGAWVLVGACAIHAFISIDLAVSAHMEGEHRKCKSYPKLNRATIFQRVGGILLIPLIALHIAGATGAMTPPKLVHSILPPLFFAVALAHVAISAGKALITLGIGSARAVRITDAVMKIFCALTWVVDVVAFYVLYGF